MTDTLTVSAPGSIMVTGEHAVVYGHPAVVAAIEQRMTIKLRTRSDTYVTIRSEIADPQTVALDEITSEGPYRFVFAALQLYSPKLEQGLEIEITSQIDPTLGLGSSAAVTVAILAGLARLTNSNPDDLHSQALSIVRELQGRGSGADLAASLHGGMVGYQLSESGPATITTLPNPPPLSLCYCGYKTPTGEVLQRVADTYRDREAEISALYTKMGATSAATIEAIRANDWDRAGQLLTSYQTYMAELGVTDDMLDRIISTARPTPNLRAAKISGSGLGDCVLAVGAVPSGFKPVQLSHQGVICHD